MQAYQQQQLLNQQRLHQAQRIQQQRLYNPQNMQMGAIDPTLLSLQYVKDEYPLAEGNNDPFSFTNEYDMLSSANHPNSLLSNISASPLDTPDYEDNISPLTPLGSASISGSPFGTPAIHQYYSMSMPARSGVTAHQSNYNMPSGNASSMNSYSNNVPAIGIHRTEDDPLKHLDIINEKRRRRRESHNAVERRRRDHINDKIQELSTLLPAFSGDAQNKPNKGTILKRSVDYVKHMQTFAKKQMDRNKELENVLGRLCLERGIDVQQLGLTVPLGTPIEVPVMILTANDISESLEMDEMDFMIPPELLHVVFSYCDPLSTLRCECVSRKWYNVSTLFESKIWYPKVRNLNPKRVDGENYKRLYQIYRSWTPKFPMLTPTMNDCCLSPTDLSFSSATDENYKITARGITLRRRLAVARIGMGSITIPIQIGNKSQLWLNSGQITRGISVGSVNDKLEIIIPAFRPLDYHVQMIHQTRSHLFACQESRIDDRKVTIRVWDPKIRNTGPWGPVNEVMKRKGVWILRNQWRGSILCGSSLFIQTGLFSCSLVSLTLDECNECIYNNLWECELPQHHVIQELTLNEVYAILLCRSNLDEPIVFVLSAISGLIVQTLEIPNCLRNCIFHISATRFHILLYSSEWLCIFDMESLNPQIINLPFIGKPVRINVSDDDSIILLAPKFQRGEIILIDVVNAKAQTLILKDGYAEGPSSRSGGLVGRSALGIWMIFVDLIVDEHGNEKRGKIHASWTKLS